MNIRQLREDERDESIDLSLFAFQATLTDEEREQRKQQMRPEETWVAEENGALMSKLTLLSFDLYLAGTQIPAGGISGVATWPEHRRGGIVRSLLEHSLKTMRENGQHLALLYPFSVPFYRKFGWEMYADKQTITLKKDQLPERSRFSGRVRRIDQDAEVLAPVYDEWARRYNGIVARDHQWWNRHVFRRKTGTVAVYRNQDGEARGYMIYSTAERTMTIKEWIWLDADARRGLSTFVSNHDSMIDQAVIETNPDGLLPFILPDPGVKREIRSYFMSRIVDLKKFFESVPVNTDALKKPLILHVDDPVCAWNRGIFILKNQCGSLAIEHFEDKPKENTACQHPPKRGVRGEIGSLTAVCLGKLSAQTLFEEEVLKSEDPDAVKMLDQLTDNREPFMYDFF
ncbi:GNAT family N-acetyltransferase [Salisediminibacterium halotolerans]|uniref:Predicted acetyltransferase n=1 Tax=Salisediminibacterium halotolerans TaxID=517425 RepID=A0A1H9UHM1_9BACI|nr:GNAT family N-acetyltransferase [Salisediminibacterium haloalkalitolerans]SES08657.1 Predicted acetyltransferase [Salisediminibacterium haloalkalitolerans]